MKTAPDRTTLARDLVPCQRLPDCASGQRQTDEKSSSLTVAVRGSFRPRLANGLKWEGCSLTRWALEDLAAFHPANNDMGQRSNVSIPELPRREPHNAPSEHTSTFHERPRVSPVDTPLNSAFPPIARTENADHSASIREPHAEDSATHPSKALIAFFLVAVRQIRSDYAARVGESLLGLKKGDPMFLLVFVVLSSIPFEPRAVPILTLALQRRNLQILVFLLDWLFVWIRPASADGETG
jgi:hypothetical protein